MTTILILLTAVAALAYALHRNHTRNLNPGCAGSTDIADRDAQRVQLELLATAGHAIRPGTPMVRLTGGHGRPCRAA